MNEFELIKHCFNWPQNNGDIICAVGDDASIVQVPQGYELVQSIDTQVADVHFPASAPAQLIAQRALRCAISDLAAMGAVPRFYTLALALSDDVSDDWVQGFAGGLKAGQERFSIMLVGGDTVATPGPITITLTAFGEVARDHELRRSGAGIGDGVFVTGTIGDAHLGLASLRGALPGLSDPARAHLVRRHQLPDPRTEIGPALAGVASACVDISDGLVQDLGHIASASGVSICMEAEQVPLSDAARQAIGLVPEYMETVFSGGDDYELAFTAPEHAAEKIAELAKKTGVPIQRIGTVEKHTNRPVMVLDAKGRDVTPEKGGFSHF